MKVCKVVFNSVSNDTRVLKEANSLSKLGYDVTIIGIATNQNNTLLEYFDKVKVVRAYWQHKLHKPSTILLLAQLLLIGVFLGLLHKAINALISIDLNSIAKYLRQLNTSSLFSFDALMYCILFVLFIFLSRILIKKFSNRKEIFSRLYNVYRLENIKSTVQHREKLHVYKRNASSYFPKLFIRYFNLQNSASLKGIRVKEDSVTKVLIQEKPDIVHAHDLSTLPLCVEYKKKYNCKLVFDAHELYDQIPQHIKSNVCNRDILQKYSNLVDKFITVNESIGEYYRKFYPQLPEPCIIRNAQNSIKNLVYDGRMHKHLSLDKTKKILLYQGGFADKRGLKQLVESVIHLDPKWVLVLIGSGKYEKKIRTIMHRHQLHDRVKIVPKLSQDQLPYWTSGASLGIIPYENVALNHWYCTPNKIWEYSRVKVPILANTLYEIDKIITKHRIGVLLNSIDPENIANTINKMTDREINAMKKRCEKFISLDNWEKYEKILKKCYDDIRRNNT